MQANLQSGDVGETPVALLLIEALRQSVTGVLSLEQKGGLAQLFLRNGWPTGCQVYDGFRPLARYLLAEGLISQETLDESLAEMARTHVNHGEVLMRMGAIEPDVLERLLLKQQIDYLSKIVGIDRGAYRFEPSADLPLWTRGIPMCTVYRAIVMAVEAPPAQALVRSTLLETAGYPLVLSADAAGLWTQFGWDDDEWRALALLMAPVAQDEFVATSGLEPRRGAAMLAALRLLGLIELADPGALQTVAADGMKQEAEAAAPPAQSAPEIAVPPFEAPEVAGSAIEAAESVASSQIAMVGGEGAAQAGNRSGEQPGAPVPAAAVEATDLASGLAAAALPVANAADVAAEAGQAPAFAPSAAVLAPSLPINPPSTAGACMPGLVSGARAIAAPQASQPITPSQYVAEALLEAYRGWIEDGDQTKLERRLWGLLNFTKGL